MREYPAFGLRGATLLLGFEAPLRFSAQYSDLICAKATSLWVMVEAV